VKAKITACVLMLVLTFGAAGSYAQTQGQTADPRSVNPSTPLPPINSGNSGTGSSGSRPVPAARGVSQGDATAYDPAQVEPDTNTLAGAELLGVGSLQHARNIFDPSISVSLLGQTGPQLTQGQSSIIFTKVIGGTLAFARVANGSRFSANYSGGDTLSQAPQPSGQFHNVSVSEELSWARWRLSMRDLFVLAPGATFTGEGMGGPGLVGDFITLNQNSSSTIAQGFAPSQTIQTGQANRYVNTVLGQVQYSFSRRAALTVTGSYGLLHFTDPGYISSHMETAQAGYDYELDSKNSIAVLGSYADIRYTDTPTTTGDYKAQLAFGRKITGKLAFEAAGGPEEIRAQGTLNGNFHILTGTATSSLKYELRRSGAGLVFSRGLSNGSGVFLGAVSDVFSGYAHHDFTRQLTAILTGGYAFNKALAPVGASAITFRDWFLGANLNRRLGRYAIVGLNYGVQNQSVPASCPVAACGIPGYAQTFGMSFNWHLHPVE
jgi:hypothetical protein